MLVEFGCKRLIVDTGYYECLHQPNVDISKDPILEINETGIVTKNRMHIVFSDRQLLITFYLNRWTTKF